MLMCYYMINLLYNYFFEDKVAFHLLCNSFIFLISLRKIINLYCPSIIHCLMKKKCLFKAKNFQYKNMEQEYF